MSVETKKRSRRSQLETYEVLVAKRDRLDREHAERMSKLNARIAEIEAKNEKKLEAKRLLESGKSVEDIDAQIKQLQELKKAAKSLT